MKADKIEVEPFSQIMVTDYDGKMQINEHGIVRIAGIIPVGKMEEYIELANKYGLVKITASELSGEAATLIYGRLTGFEMNLENNVANMMLEVKTGTCCMEIDEHTRSFQDSSITYRKALDTCNASYQDCNIIMTEGKDTRIPGFILQYKETDWAFIKRLASCLHTALVPDTQTGGINYFFGLPKWKRIQFPYTDSYKVGRDMDEYLRKKTQGLEIWEADCTYYIVKSREIIRIGAFVEFLGKELYVYKVESTMKFNELVHTYYLKTIRGLACKSAYNERLIGASLYGKVTSVKEDKVQVCIREDENKECGYRWFPFSTVYSSPDGTGWYCMPERGDTIRLCFPSNNAQDTYVNSAVHEYSDERTEPEIKFIKNRQGKEIRLAPDSILLTNNEGTSVELSDRNGILMKSGDSITLQADNRILINSHRANIILDAAKRIRLKQGEAEINISDDVTMEGMHVKLH